MKVGSKAYVRDKGGCTIRPFFLIGLYAFTPVLLVRVRNLRTLCTKRGRMGTLKGILRSGTIGAVRIRKLYTSSTPLLFDDLTVTIPRIVSSPFIFILSSTRRTNCFCRSLARVLKRQSILCFPSSFHQTIGFNRHSTTGRVLQARIIDHLTTKGYPLFVIACPRTVTRGVMSQRGLRRRALGLRAKRQISVIFMRRALTTFNFGQISCICRPKRFTIHNDVLSIFSFTSR